MSHNKNTYSGGLKKISKRLLFCEAPSLSSDFLYQKLNIHPYQISLKVLKDGFYNNNVKLIVGNIQTRKFYLKHVGFIRIYVRYTTSIQCLIHISAVACKVL